jgi:hypothetical protein
VAPNKKVTIIPDELKAVKLAIKQAEPDSVTIVFAEDIKGLIKFLHKAQQLMCGFENVRMGLLIHPHIC